MKNPYLTPADFWQERDFGKKISAAFDFIGAHFKPLIKCVAYFVLPFMLLMGIGFGLFFNTMYNQLGSTMQGRASSQLPFDPASGNSPFTGTSFLGVGLMVIGILLAFLMLSSTVYAYLRLRLRLPATEPITPTLVWAELWSRLGRVLLAGLLLFGLGMLAFAVVGGAAFGIIKGLGDGAGIGLVVLVGLALWVGLAYVSVTLSFYMPVLWLEELPVFASLGRCFQLIKGNWWNTFGLMLVTSLLQSTLTYVFAIPMYAVMVGKMLQVPSLNSDVLGLIGSSIYAIGSTLR